MISRYAILRVRKLMRRLLFILSLSVPLMGQDSTLAVTTEGVIVILYPDKTWTESKMTIPSANNSPSIDDIEIISVRSYWSIYGWFKVAGEIKNNGRVAMGAEIEVAARNARGELITASTSWPNSVNNIRPGGTIGFDYRVTEDRSATRATVQVTSVHIW